MVPCHLSDSTSPTAVFLEKNKIVLKAKNLAFESFLFLSQQYVREIEDVLSPGMENV